MDGMGLNSHTLGMEKTPLKQWVFSYNHQLLNYLRVEKSSKFGEQPLF